MHKIKCAVRHSISRPGNKRPVISGMNDPFGLSEYSRKILSINLYGRLMAGLWFVLPFFGERSVI